MRIGIDASNLRSGGGMTHISELLAHCEPERHGIEKITVWAHPSALDRLPIRPWLEVVRLPALEGGLIRRIAWQMFERSRLAQASCDIVFAPGGTPAGSFRPFVSMSTNMLPFSPQELRRFGWTFDRIRMLLLRRQQAKSFRDASAVIFLTEYARRTISEAVRLPADRRVEIIASGVNTRFLAPPRPQRPLASYSASEPFRFLYVSDLLPYKHHATVVRAVAQLHAKGLPVALDIIGHPGMERSRIELQKVLADAACKAIRYLGPANHDALPPVYRDAGAFVFASTCENLPMTLVEAMAAGLPIAASASGPMPEILGAGAAFFDPEDHVSIGDALHRLALDPALRELSARTAHTQATTYSWSDCAARTFAMLAELARCARVEDLDPVTAPIPI